MTVRPVSALGITVDESARAARYGVVLLSTSMAMFAVFLDTTIGFVTFPAISHTFKDAGADTVSWVLNAYTLTFASLLIPAGRLADRVGHRRMFLWGAATFTVGSMLCGLAPNVWVLIGTEALEAAGAAMLVPASLAIVLRTFPPQRIPFAVALWGIGGAVAGASGPPIGALVVEHLGWRWAFFINLPVGILSVALAWRVLPSTERKGDDRLPDAVGVALVCGGVAAIALGIVKSASWGFGSAATWLCLIGGLSSFAAFVQRSRRVPNPMIRLELFSLNGFRWANTATAFFAIGFNAMFLSNILFLTRVWGYSIVRAGAAVCLGPITVGITSPFLGRLAGRIGQRRLLLVGGFVWAVVPLWQLARVSTAPAYLSTYLPGVIISGLGVGLCGPQLSSAAVKGLPAGQLATGSAVSQAIRNLGATLGVALVVALTSEATGPGALEGFQRVWWLISSTGIAVTLCATRLSTVPAPAPSGTDHS